MPFFLPFLCVLELNKLYDFFLHGQIFDSRELILRNCFEFFHKFFLGYFLKDLSFCFCDNSGLFD